LFVSSSIVEETLTSYMSLILSVLALDVVTEDFIDLGFGTDIAVLLDATLVGGKFAMAVTEGIYLV
jgi:hypothetical protein